MAKAKSLTNEEFMADPRLKLALNFAVMDTLFRLRVPSVPPGFVEACVETTLQALEDVEGMAQSLNAVRYMNVG